MPSPVPDLSHVVLAGFVGALSLLGACAPASTADAQSSERPRQQPFVQFTAEGSNGHRLELLTTPAVFDHAFARLTFNGQVWETSDVDCPAFRRAIETYQRLPPVRLGPSLLLTEDFRTDRIPPGRLDAETWTLRADLHGPDGSAMRAEMRAINGSYASWVSDTVLVVRGCTSPSPVQ